MQYLVPTVDDRDVWNVYLSALWAPTVYAADKAGLFAHLAEGSGSAADLAARTGLNQRALEAVLALLASLGFVVKRGGQFMLNAVGQTYMTPGSPYCWSPIWRKKRKRSVDTDFILAALRAKPGADKDEVRPWETPGMTAEVAQIVADTMNAHSLVSALGVARNFPFDGVRRLLDVGGGGGCYAIAFAQQHADLHCTVLDLPEMCAVVDRNVAADGVADRVSTISLNMFAQDWPGGYDALFMSNVLHDWGDETCADLLARSFAALPSGGQVMLHELLFDDSATGPTVAAAFSVLMLGTYGKQRSFAEFERMLTAAGFVDVAARSTSIFFSVVSARKP